METFTVKSASKEVSQKPHFYVLNKGMNAGKPMVLPCPNCFVVEANSEEIKETLYWVSFALWRSKAFHPMLVGSVIPFIRIKDYKKTMCEKLNVVKAQPEEFNETMKQLRFIELKEKQFNENLRLLSELKRAYVHRYFHRYR